MEKEELLLIHGTEYKEMTKEILYAAGLEAQIGARDKKIGIKPNLVAPSEAFLGATTHPEIVAGIIEYLQEAGNSHRSCSQVQRSGISEYHHAGRFLGRG